MDVFKLAFETTIVGLLAFLWLGMAVDLVYPAFFAEIVPEARGDGKSDALLGVGVLSLAYCIGSAIVPISGQLVNDEHWPVPEDSIRCLVLEEQNQRLDGIKQIELLKPYEPGDDFDVCHRGFFERFREKNPETNQRIVTRDTIWAGVLKTFDRRDKDRQAQDAKKQRESDKKLDNILTKFQLIETKILNQQTEITDRLKLLHERIVVLRGAVFSGISLFLICLFGTIASANGNSSPWKRRLWGTLLAVALTLFSVVNGLEDLSHFHISDIPALESLLGIITLFGGFLVYYGVKDRPYLGKRIVLVAGFFAALSYGGWMWSEAIYDQQVISSYAVLERGPRPAVSK
jgi:hypothetical protein